MEEDHLGIHQPHHPPRTSIFVSKEGAFTAKVTDIQYNNDIYTTVDHYGFFTYRSVCEDSLTFNLHAADGLWHIARVSIQGNVSAFDSR